MHALYIAWRLFNGTLGNNDLEVTRTTRTLLHSKQKWKENELVLVPKVQGISYVVVKKSKDAQRQFGGLVLPRACGVEDDGKVYVLQPCLKMPKKGQDAGKNPEKFSTVPAWVARRSSDKKECNMEQVDLPVDEVLTLGGCDQVVHASSSSLQVPVFTNFKEIQKDDELVIYVNLVEAAEKEIKKVPVQTWRTAVAAAKAKAKAPSAN